MNRLPIVYGLVDSRMALDYCDFGDVITFDTTYGTNKELKLLGVFVGFNYHRQMVIFGGKFLVLVYNVLLIPNMV